MRISPEQKDIIDKVINCFETGKKEGVYHQVTILPDGPGKQRQVTYGKAQVTEFGRLKELLLLYKNANGIYRAEIAKGIDQIGKWTLADNKNFKAALRFAGLNDPKMRECQDLIFDRYYYEPAKKWCNENGFTSALALLVVYDSFIHSGAVPVHLRRQFPEAVPINGGEEQKWLQQYVETRHAWFVNHTNELLRNCTYRTRCFKDMLKCGNWDLSKKPIVANGVTL